MMEAATGLATFGIDPRRTVCQRTHDDEPPVRPVTTADDEPPALPTASHVARTTPRAPPHEAPASAHHRIAAGRIPPAEVRIREVEYVLDYPATHAVKLVKI
jgi:hypothetical protein